LPTRLAAFLLDNRRQGFRESKSSSGRREGLRRAAAPLGGRASFSWFGRIRCLAKDYENLADTLTAFVTLAAIQLGIKRLARALAFE
jgi:hypothetical protein